MASLSNLSWPVSSMGDALAELALKSGLTSEPQSPANPPEGLTSDQSDRLEQWIDLTCTRMGIEAEPVGASYPEVEGLIQGAAPAVLFVPGAQSRFIVLLRGGRKAVKVLAPDLTARRILVTDIRQQICQKIEEPFLKQIDQALDAAGLRQDRRRSRSRAAILQHQLSDRWIGGCFLVRHSPGSRFFKQLRWSGSLNQLYSHVALHLVAFFLFILSWWMIGRGALAGHLDRGWLLAWALVLVSLIPFRLLSAIAQARFNLSAGGLLRQRLLYGAARLEPEEIRNEGAGRLLARVLESEAFQTLALSGGFLALMAGLELVVAAAVLWSGAGGPWQAALLVAWTVGTVSLGWRYYRHRRFWTTARREMTNHLVEAMVGYRTRLAQQPRHLWHEGEDQGLHDYIEASRRMDHTAEKIAALVPRGWLVLGLVSLTPAFVAETTSLPSLAVGLGGVLLAYRALGTFSAGLAHLAGAGIAWHEIAPLFGAASRPVEMGSVEAVSEPTAGQEKSRLLDAAELMFAYRGRAEPVLRNCSLQVEDGDRILLQGPSGSGKSTLMSLLAGLRIPQSGVILLRGWDRHTLGAAGWAREVVEAPQFHENHVIAETFAFNLLMGRRWPPRPEDLEEAEEICRELGLGDLLERMPAGLFQMVGETGWQLSHGEKSRLFVARALLQGTDLVILDESFAALDPENLNLVLEAVLKRAPSLMLVAHP